MHLIWALKSLDMSFLVEASPNDEIKSCSSFCTYSGLLNSSGDHFCFRSAVFRFSLFPGFEISIKSSACLAF